MNRILSLLLAATFILTAAMPTTMVFAAGDIGLQQAITIVKTKFDIPEAFSRFTSETNSYDRMIMYHLNWNTEDSRSSGWASATVMGDGLVTNFHIWDGSMNWDDPMRFPKLSKEQQKQAVVEHLRRIDPELLAQIDLADLDADAGGGRTGSSVHFTASRIVNGVRVIGNFINMQINADTGQLIGYSCNWDNSVVFPDPNRAISLEAAQAAYIDKLDIELSYRSAYHFVRSEDENRNRPARLVYTGNDTAIDALTGDIFEPGIANEWAFRSGSAGAPTVQAESDSAGYTLTGAEQEEVTRAANHISPERAEQIVRAITEIKLAEHHSLESFTYRRDWNNDQEFDLHMTFVGGFGAEEEEQLMIPEEPEMPEAPGTSDIIVVPERADIIEKPEISVNSEGAVLFRADGRLPVQLTEQEHVYITLNAVTGVLKSVSISTFRSYMPKIAVELRAVDTAKSLKIAKEFAAKYAPDQSGSIHYETENNNSTHFMFNRMVNGVKYQNNYISVGVDPENDRITQFHLVWNNERTFESMDGIISVEAARDILFDKVGLELSYVIQHGSENSRTAHLVYRLKSSPSSEISAVTGDLLNHDFTVFIPRSDRKTAFNDLEGHFAKDIIHRLLEYDMVAMTDDGIFRPDEYIAQEELLAMALKLRGNWGIIPLERIYDEWMINEIVEDDERAPGALVRREEAAKFIVRTLGYGKAAILEDIFDSRFNDKKDISQGLHGYVAIARALRVVSGDENGNFNPQRNVTRAESAIMLYNFLSRQ